MSSKLAIIGTIKIDSDERRDHFLANLGSMNRLGDIFEWRINIIGRWKEWAAERLTAHYTHAYVADGCITHDEQASTYDLMSSQLQATFCNVFLWQEDHWFLCAHPSFFPMLYNTFLSLHADILTVTHLTTSWACKLEIPMVYLNPLAGAYTVDLAIQEKYVWSEHPNAFLTGTPAIYSWTFCHKLLQFRAATLRQTKLPDFELSAKHGRQFLAEGNSFVEVIPRIHVFREVFRGNKHPRSVEWDDAVAWLKLRDGGSSILGGDPNYYDSDRRDTANGK